MHFTRLRRAFWQAFLHGQFSIAKAAAYSSILTLFPAFLVVASVLEASHNTEGFLNQIASVVHWLIKTRSAELPAGTEIVLELSHPMSLGGAVAGGGGE